jgi:hypothetical protein
VRLVVWSNGLHCSDWKLYFIRPTTHVDDHPLFADMRFEGDEAEAFRLFKIARPEAERYGEVTTDDWRGPTATLRSALDDVAHHFNIYAPEPDQSEDDRAFVHLMKSLPPEAQDR